VFSRHRCNAIAKNRKDTARPSTTERAYVDERGAVGIRLGSAAAIVRQ